MLFQCRNALYENSQWFPVTGGRGAAALGLTDTPDLSLGAAPGAAGGPGLGGAVLDNPSYVRSKSLWSL